VPASALTQKLNCVSNVVRPPIKVAAALIAGVGVPTGIGVVKNTRIFPVNIGKSELQGVQAVVPSRQIKLEAQLTLVARFKTAKAETTTDSLLKLPVATANESLTLISCPASILGSQI